MRALALARLLALSSLVLVLDQNHHLSTRPDQNNNNLADAFHSLDIEKETETVTLTFELTLALHL